MAITLIAGLGVFQTCPTNVAAIPILNMVAAISFLDCISTGRAVLHVPIPFAPFKQSCIRVFLVFLVCLTRYERMVLEMALGADLHRVSPTDKRFVFCVSRRHLVNRWAIGCCAETVKSWVRCNKCISRML